MKIVPSSMQCRSIREVLIVLLSFSLLSLFVTYHLGTLPPIPKSIIPPDAIAWNQMTSKVVGTFAKSPSSSSMADQTANAIRLTSLQQKFNRLLKTIEDRHLQALMNTSKVALIWGKHRNLERDLPLYQDLLLKHRFTMKVLPPVMPFRVEHQDMLNGMSSSQPSATRSSAYQSRRNSHSNGWWLLMCLSYSIDVSSDEGSDCFNKRSYLKLQPHQKINQIPGMQDVLWSTKGLCNTYGVASQIASFRKRLVAPLCFQLPEQWSQFDGAVEALGDDVRWLIKGADGRGLLEMLTTKDIQNIQRVLQQSGRGFSAIVQQFFPNPLFVFGSLVSLRVYVLVTSILPLRLFLFNQGLVNFRSDHTAGFKKMPGKLWTASQLWHYITQNYGRELARTAMLDVQHAIVETMLIAELLLAANFSSLPFNTTQQQYRCEHCFQLLEFELIFNSSLHPVILKINGDPTVQERYREDGFTSEQVCRSLVDSMLELLFNTSTVANDISECLEQFQDSIGLMGSDCMLYHDFCLTSGDLEYLLDSRRQALNKGGFRQIYPSIDVAEYDTFLTELDNVFNSQQPSSSVHSPISSSLDGRHSTGEFHRFLSQVELLYARRLAELNNEVTWDAGSLSSEFPRDFSKLDVDYVPSDLKSRLKCSEDPSTLPYVSSIHADPPIDMSPPFSMAVMDYYVNVSYDQLMIKVWAFALNCQCEVRLDDKIGTSQPTNYTLGIGQNRIAFVVVDVRHEAISVVNVYTVIVHRHSVNEIEPWPYQEDSHWSTCLLKQECELRVSPLEPCGLQPDPNFQEWTRFMSYRESLPLCDKGDASGAWALPCFSCARRTTCVWSRAIWAPFNCRHGYTTQQNLSACLGGKKLLFIGDSTNRGMMHYLMERLNGTLTEWDKTHNLKIYTNVNDGKTSISFVYYPQFWLSTNERPVFEKALYQLIQKSRPLHNDTQTILVVGGVHWLATQHLHILLRVLKSEGLEGIRIVMKTLGSGFHLPVDGVHSLTKNEYQKLLQHSMGLAYFARHYNFEVVDTFNVTIARYKDFLQGKCACHFHKVVPIESSEQTNSRATAERSVANRIAASQVPLKTADVVSGESKEYIRYHVEGTINAIYSEILISRICSKYRH